MYSAFSLQIPKSCADLDPTLLYISILGTYSKFVRKNKIQALGVCFQDMLERWPQVCRVKITFESIRFDKNEPDKMLCKLDSTKYARSFKPNQPLNLKKKCI